MDNVIQSYFTTIMKGNFSLIEVRIFIKIVEQANLLLQGANGSKLIGRSFCADGLNCNLIVPIETILGDNCHDYSRAKKAFKNLADKKVEFYDGAKKSWFYTPFVSNIRVAENDGMAHFTVARWLMEYIVNFMYCNYSRYNLAAALSLPSAYAVRLYWLTCSQSTALDWNIQTLRDILGVGDKYPKTKDFIRRCIAPAEEVLEKRGLNGFKAIKVFKGNKITSLRFEPVKRENNHEQDKFSAVTDANGVNQMLVVYLVGACGFTANGIKNNAELLKGFAALPDWQGTLNKIVRHARKKRAGAGYYINAMRAEMEGKTCRNLAEEVTNRLRATGNIISSRRRE